MKKKLIFLYIKINRFIFRRKFLPIMSGPLKGLKWTTSMNYEYLTGSYIDQDEQQVIKNILDVPQPVFYDVGANVGYFSSTVSKLVPAAQIFAFEPVKEHLASMRTHITMNGINNVNIQPLAVSDSSRELVFSNVEKSEGNTYKNESELFRNAAGSFTVQSTSVDDFVAAGNKPPHLLKIDVEGAELDVLNGAIQTIRHYKPSILLATHDCHIPGIKDRCVNFLKEQGYSLKVIGAEGKHVAGLEDFIATPPTA